LEERAPPTRIWDTRRHRNAAKAIAITAEIGMRSVSASLAGAAAAGAGSKIIVRVLQIQ